MRRTSWRLATFRVLRGSYLAILVNAESLDGVINHNKHDDDELAWLCSVFLCFALLCLLCYAMLISYGILYTLAKNALCRTLYPQRERAVSRLCGYFFTIKNSVPPSAIRCLSLASLRAQRHRVLRA